MATTISGNPVYADPTQRFDLTYTFANSKFTWTVTATASHTSYWNSIYGLTVNVGGNSYYRGDIDWRNYTPNTVVYNGETKLSDCTISGGQVTLSVSGNFYYGTWNTDYRSSGSGTCPVAPPTVTALTYTATNKYSSMVVAGRSVITFTMNGTSNTGSDTITYSLYQDGSVISTTTGSSSYNKTVNVTAPSAGSHTYKYTATDENGTSTTSGNVSITTYAYVPPAFSSVSAVRWSTGNSSGVASDEGTYCKATANFSQGKVGTTAITTTCTIKVDTYTGTATNGTAIWLGGGNLSADNTYSVTFTLSDGYGNSVVTTDTLTQGGRGLDFIYSGGHYGIAMGQKATANQVDLNMSTNINTGNLKVGAGHISMVKSTNPRLCITEQSSIGNVLAGDPGNEAMFLGFAGTPASQTQGLYSRGYYNGSAWQTSGRYIFDRNNTGVITVDTNRIQAGNRPYYVMQPITSGGTDVLLDAERFVWRNGSDTMTVGFNPLQFTSTYLSRSSGQTISSYTFSVWGRWCQLTLKLNASSGSYSAGSNIFVGKVSALIPKTDVMGCGFYLGGSYIGWIDTSGNITIRATSALNFSGGTAIISWSYIYA